MTAHADDGRLTFAEWVKAEEQYEGRHELVNGMLVAMAGGTERHDVTVQALFEAIRPSLRGTPCRVLVQNRKLRTFDGNGHYPDLLVRCGPPADRTFEDDARVVVEVVSPSNHPLQPVQKLNAYQQLPSIEVVLFVHHERRFVAIHRRDDRGTWTERRATTGEIELGTAVVDLDQLWAEVDAESYTD